MLISLKNVTYSYGAADDAAAAAALDGVTLGIARGESVAVIGANGSGKSTLLRLINGLAEPSSGTYEFDGEPVTRGRLRDAAFAKRFHARIGFVFQNPDAQLFCPTVYDEVAFAPRQLGLPEDEVAEWVGNLLKLLGLEASPDRAPYRLSGGEKRRTALAAELAKDPEVLTLDEWTEGLDPRSQRRMTDFLADFHASGRTLVFATHDLALARALAGRVALFSEEHRVIADGGPEVLDDVELLRRANVL